VWFSCSAGLSIFNKLIFGQNHTAFPCPLLMTATQVPPSSLRRTRKLTVQLLASPSHGCGLCTPLPEC
jgi:hypothetical protein